MSLSLFNPLLARLSCAECQAYQIDYDWQKRTGTGNRQQRHGQDWQRQGPPPCMERPDEPTPICPKKSPKHEAEYKLSATNRRVWELFLALQAGAEVMSEDEKRDPLLRRKLAILAGLWEQRRQAQQSDLVTSLAMLTIGRR